LRENSKRKKDMDLNPRSCIR